MRDIDTYQKGCLQTESVPEKLVETDSQANSLLNCLKKIQDLGKDSDILKKSLFYKKDMGGLPRYTKTHTPADLESIINISTQSMRLVHAILGIQSELEELVEPALGHILEGKPLDEVNIGEEFVDVTWYCATGLDAVNQKYSDQLARNRDKLHRRRYKKGYSDSSAAVRNLVEERKALESAPLTVDELLSIDGVAKITFDKITGQTTVYRKLTSGEIVKETHITAHNNDMVQVSQKLYEEDLV